MVLNVQFAGRWRKSTEVRRAKQIFTRRDPFEKGGVSAVIALEIELEQKVNKSPAKGLRQVFAA